MIHPNVVKYTDTPAAVRNRTTLPVTSLPASNLPATADRCIIDRIRSQPKPPDIHVLNTSAFASDVKLMVSFIGAYCSADAINAIYQKIQEIHDTLNSKDPPEIKNWIRLLTGLHPELDNKIRSLGYWAMPYSEYIGTNTITYYPHLDSIDLTNWGKKPKFTTNKVEWFTEPWEAPQYIREVTRHKMSAASVDYVQNSNHIAVKCLKRNIIREAYTSTKPGTGSVYAQPRPIMPEVSHGVSLNNDWYHQTYRIMTSGGVKVLSKADAIAHLTSSGQNVHKLVNHITPLNNICSAQSTTAQFIAPLGVEETAPHRPSVSIEVDNSGQKVLATPSAINNNSLIPEIIQGE